MALTARGDWHFTLRGASVRDGRLSLGWRGTAALKGQLVSWQRPGRSVPHGSCEKTAGASESMGVEVNVSPSPSPAPGTPYPGSAHGASQPLLSDRCVHSAATPLGYCYLGVSEAGARGPPE